MDDWATERLPSPPETLRISSGREARMTLDVEALELANVIIRPDWWLPDRIATPQALYSNRRDFLRTMGLGLGALSIAGCGSEFVPTQVETPDPSCDADPPNSPFQTVCPSPNADLFPAARNNIYQVNDRPITDPSITLSHNNYYEFIGRQNDFNTVWDLMGPFQVRPWTIEIAGEADNTGVFGVDNLEREFGLQERVYRHRCVERWSIAVPWTGYPLSDLIMKAQPRSSATHVRFICFDKPSQAVGQRTQPWYTWPFTEAVRIDEALNELAFVVTGAYGNPLSKQNGAPLRLVFPWKYGFKSVKGFVRMEFVTSEPSTFWTDFAPNEYGFLSNVNPAVPHPRWSQEEEIFLGQFEPIPTQLYNGYTSTVGNLYDPETLTYLS